MPTARRDSEGRAKRPPAAGWRGRVSGRAVIVGASLLALSLLLSFYALCNSPRVRKNPDYIMNIYRATPSPTAAPSPKPGPTAR